MGSRQFKWVQQAKQIRNVPAHVRVGIQKQRFLEGRATQSLNFLLIRIGGAAARLDHLIKRGMANFLTCA